MGIVLERGETMFSSAQPGAVARECIKPFDLDIEESRGFKPYILPPLDSFSIGLIVGGSGSGKSTLLKEFGNVEEFSWDDRSVADYWDDPDSATKALYAAGLNSIPSWLMSYDELSTGQKFRVDLARRLKSGAVVDEFTSVVDRNVAISASASVARYIRKSGIGNIVFATCHKDVIAWLAPDWIIDTDCGELFIEEAKPISWYKEFVGEVVGGLRVE